MPSHRLAVPLALALAACLPPQATGQPLRSPTNAEAFEGVSCSAVRPQTEPDLMGWDPGSRLNLKRIRSEGVVAVRYVAEGCNVKLELLSNCVGTGTYKYTPYSANEHKMAHDASELFAQLPIGAANLTGKVKGDRALRTDYMLVGQYSLPTSATFRRADLKGHGCERATHVVSAAYVGGFALVSGEERELDTAATVFGLGAGSSHLASLERLADEGDAEACKDAQKNQRSSGACDVPLRIGLLELDLTADPIAPASAAPAPATAHPAPAAPRVAPAPGPAPAPLPAAPPSPAPAPVVAAARPAATGSSVYDARTTLTWQRAAPTASVTWEGAASYCASLPLDGETWRLPSVKELSSLAGRNADALVRQALTPATERSYWSSEHHDWGTAEAVAWPSGAASTVIDDQPAAVRCVR